jgi:hypothetical protein
MQLHDYLFALAIIVVIFWFIDFVAWLALGKNWKTFYQANVAIGPMILQGLSNVIEFTTLGKVVLYKEKSNEDI